MDMKLKVTVWNEFRHEKIQEHEAYKIYPMGIHTAIAEFLGKTSEFEIQTATLDEEEHGLCEKVLNSTDILIWWGHMAHHEVCDKLVEKIQERVLKGMGLIVLHSGHHSKVFKRLMGTSCNLLWRDDDRERIWTVNPAHEIAQGIPLHFDLEMEEMYGERFDIPEPDELVFMGWFKGGEVFRSGCCFKRGYGRIFYFQPGHEAYPTYYNEHVQRIIYNAVKWAKPLVWLDKLECPNPEALEK